MQLKIISVSKNAVVLSRRLERVLPDSPLGLSFFGGVITIVTEVESLLETLRNGESRSQLVISGTRLFQQAKVEDPSLPPQFLLSYISPLLQLLSHEMYQTAREVLLYFNPEIRNDKKINQAWLKIVSHPDKISYPSDFHKILKDIFILYRELKYFEVLLGEESEDIE